MSEKILSRSDRLKDLRALLETSITILNASEEERLVWEAAVLEKLYPFRHEDIEDVLHNLIDTLIRNDRAWDPDPGNPHPLTLYKKEKFSSFMDYFTRELSDETSETLREKCLTRPLVMMSESDVESIGSISDTSSIISLKKPSEDVVATLKKLDFPISDEYHFINTKLLLTYYHRIHCPVAGKIVKLTSIAKEDNFFGDNALWIVKFDFWVYFSNCFCT